jgi:ribosomal protein S18 acetylase RimI-like enzyme
MKIERHQVNLESITKYARIPIYFEVNSKINITLIGPGLQGINFKEEKVNPSYIKDYDSSEEPKTWLKIFNTKNWRLFTCRENDQYVAGAIVAHRTPEVHMLDGRIDLAMIWDIRVHPDYRQKGIGSSLFSEVVKWSKQKGCKQLKIETQNVNVPACKFYIKQGCTLGEVNFHKYINSKSSANEIMLVWYLNL